MQLLLIDDQGDLWVDTASTLRASFAPDVPNDTCSNYVVKNLGFVAVDVFGRSCQVRVRPAMVSEASLQTLYAWLETNGFERVALGYFDSDWHLELHAGVGKLKNRLNLLVDGVRVQRPSHFVAEARSLDGLHAYPCLSALIANWSSLRAEPRRSQLIAAVKTLTGGRFTLLKVERDSDRLVIDDTGSGYLTYGSDWPKRARGAPFAKQPDRDYGSWLEETFAPALISDSPLVHDVDAIVSTPAFGRYRLRYKRLILPFERDGQRYLLASSAIESGIDLRAARADDTLQVTDRIPRADARDADPDAFKMVVGKDEVVGDRIVAGPARNTAFVDGFSEERHGGVARPSRQAQGS